MKKEIWLVAEEPEAAKSLLCDKKPEAASPLCGTKAGRDQISL